jgi:putative oxidoreductase
MMNAVSRQLYERSLGLLLLRVGVGLVFFMHGLSKVQGISGTEMFFSHGLGLPVWVAIFIAWLEVIGGIALILGVFTRGFAFAFGIEMIVAIFITGLGKGGWSGHELEALLMVTSFSIVYLGSGRFSLWRVECQNCGAFACRLEDCPKRK